MKDLILAIDQGTTGSTAALFSSTGQLVAKTNFEFSQHYPEPGWVEHKPQEIWSSVRDSILKTLKVAKVKPDRIACIGVTNQRETVVAWDKKTDAPIYPAIVWQCRRTSSDCEKLKKKGLEPKIKKKTGLVLDPYFSGSKMAWIMKNVESAKTLAKKDRLAFGTIDSYLIWKLTNGTSHKTDVSNASRTMLMDLEICAWDKELTKLFKVPPSSLPSIEASNHSYGETCGLDFLPDGIPITGVVGDQQAALFGQACYSVGQAKCTFGTGSFILINSGTNVPKSKSGLLSTVAWKLEGHKTIYALEGGAFICGAAVQWLRDQLGFIKSSSEVEDLASQVEDSAGVEFVPALVGLGAPYWDSNVRGVLSGLTRGTSRTHIARATLEAMALQNVDILNAMQKDLGKKLKLMRVDGGASANNLLMQMQADYLGCVTERPDVIETTAAGAAFMAGLGQGLWSRLDDVAAVWKSNRVYQVEMPASARKKRLVRWHKAIQRARVV